MARYRGDLNHDRRGSKIGCEYRDAAICAEMIDSACGIAGAYSAIGGYAWYRPCHRRICHCEIIRRMSEAPIYPPALNRASPRPMSAPTGVGAYMPQTVGPNILRTQDNVMGAEREAAVSPPYFSLHNIPSLAYSANQW